MFAFRIFISVIVASFGSMAVYGFAGRRRDADVQSINLLGTIGVRF